jgi:hypothetical protein
MVVKTVVRPIAKLSESGTGHMPQLDRLTPPLKPYEAPKRRHPEDAGVKTPVRRHAQKLAAPNGQADPIVQSVSPTCPATSENVRAIPHRAS